MVTPTPDTEPDMVGQELLYRLSKLAQVNPARKFSSIACERGNDEAWVRRGQCYGPLLAET